MGVRTSVTIPVILLDGSRDSSGERKGGEDVANSFDLDGSGGHVLPRELKKAR